MTETEEIASLLTHPGYLRLLERARAEWVVGYPGKVKLAVQKALEGEKDVGAFVLAVDAACDAVNAMLSWPEHRRRELEAQASKAAQPPSLSRSGLP